ncbi:MAG: hypothetical protein WD314_01165 [Trueperaceae bacterium]
MTAIRLGLTGLLLAAISACAPTAVDEPAGPLVALINAPAEQRVSMVAATLQQEVTGVRSCCSFSFARSQPVRFQETHRDLFGSRAAPQAASLARNLGARLAVMAGAPRYERTVESVDGGREVRGVVQLRATVLDADSGEQLGTVGSLTFRDRRLEGEDQQLPEVEDDPLMIDLTRQAVSDLAPHLAALLEDLSEDFATGSSF